MNFQKGSFVQIHSTYNYLKSCLICLGLTKFSYKSTSAFLCASLLQNENGYNVLTLIKMFTGSLTCFNFVELSSEVQIVVLFVTHQKVYLRP